MTTSTPKATPNWPDASKIAAARELARYQRDCPRCGARYQLPKRNGRTSSEGALKHIAQHEASKRCRADALARELFQAGFVPFPGGHSVPTAFKHLERAEETRAVFGLEHEGEIDRGTAPSTQFWYPRWARCVTETFGALGIYEEPGRWEHRARTPDAIERTIAMRWKLLDRASKSPELAKAVDAAYSLGGRGAVLDLALDGFDLSEEEVRGLRSKLLASEVEEQIARGTSTFLAKK